MASITYRKYLALTALSMHLIFYFAQVGQAYILIQLAYAFEQASQVRKPPVVD